MDINTLYLTDEEAIKYLDGPINGAKTLMDRVTGNSTIIIDSTLPPQIQEAYLVHERVQLGVIQEAIRDGNPPENILHIAHGAGAVAGEEYAQKRGFLDTFLRYKER